MNKGTESRNDDNLNVLLNTQSKDVVKSTDLNLNMNNTIVEQTEAAINTVTNEIKKTATKTNENIKENLEKIAETSEKGYEKFKKKSRNTIKKMNKEIKQGLGIPLTKEEQRNDYIETIPNSKNKINNNKNNNNYNNKTKSPFNNIKGTLGLILMVVILGGIAYAIYYYYKFHDSSRSGGVTLLDKVVDGKSSLNISQNPNNPNSVLIKNSMNREGGMEFSYSFWILINNIGDKLQHVFHKGDKDAYKLNTDKTHPSMNPGVFILPKKNTMRFFLNVLTKDIKVNPTAADLQKHIDIKNLPIKKWINVVFVFKEGKEIDEDYFNGFSIYINGLLKTKIYLESTPILNSKDLWINMNSGFDGYIGSLKYYPKAIGKKEIFKLTKECPKTSGCGVEADCPPYLEHSWWFN